MSGGGTVTWPPAEVADNQLSTLVGLAVDVYHINIGTGDAAIYYLVQYPPPSLKSTNPFALPYIHRACLIDGGKSGGAEQIKKFLKYVWLNYSFSTSQGGRTGLSFPPFDSIVITHWDNG